MAAVDSSEKRKRHAGMGDLWQWKMILVTSSEVTANGVSSGVIGSREDLLTLDFDYHFVTDTTLPSFATAIC